MATPPYTPTSIAGMRDEAWARGNVAGLAPVSDGAGHAPGTPVLTAAQTNALLADKASASALTAHTGNTSNPHATTAAQVGALPTTGGTLTGPLTLTNLAATSTVTAAGATIGNGGLLVNRAVGQPVDGLVVKSAGAGNHYFFVTPFSAGEGGRIRFGGYGDSGYVPLLLNDCVTVTNTSLSVAGSLTATGTVTAAGATFSGQVNLGGASGHSYFDANGDLRQRSGGDFVIYNSAGQADIIIRPFDPTVFRGGIFFQLNAKYGFTLGDYDNPAGITVLGSKPLIVGATSTALSGNVIELALPTVCRSTIQPATINFATTPGPAGKPAWGFDVTYGHGFWDGTNWHNLAGAIVP